jgi:photosystem II stability/assembly factor-like uncharacterized protein
MVKGKSQILVALLLSAFLFAGIANAQEKLENSPAQMRIDGYAKHVEMRDSSVLKSVVWEYIGPDVISGRCTDVDVPKGDKKTIYVGSATGGAWKTSNTGVTWEHITKDFPSPSIGDIAVDQNDSNIVWIGTGEANIFRASVAGTGIYKSTDAGKSFELMGLEESGTIARIVIHPTNSDIVYVAVPGNEWTNNEERGIFKTTDGGKSWAKVLYISDHIGAADLVIDPDAPNTLYASMWNRTRERWSDPRPSPGDGIFKTTDGGKTWTQKTAGLPDTKLTGRIGLDIARSNTDVIYAYVDNHNPGRKYGEDERDAYGRPKTGNSIAGAEVYRSDDKGETWVKMSPADRYMEGFGGTYGWVFAQLRVDPTDENTLYIMGLRLSKSTDAGKTWQTVYYPGLHGDHHGLWIDPSDPSYMINTNDGGIYTSYDAGLTWRGFYKELPLVQFYNISFDNETPFNVYGSVQDHGTYRGSSAYRPGQWRRNRVPNWEGAPGGEGTIIAIDPENSNLVYSSAFYGRLMRSELIDGQWDSKNISPKAEEGAAALRGQWLTPTILSPHDNKTVFHGMQYLYRSKDRGDTWEKISDDLTYNDSETMGKLPFAIPFHTLTAVSESPLKEGLIYTGSDDGRVHVTKDGGASWTEVTAGLPFNKHVSRVVASKYDEATVYLTQNGRRDDDFTLYIFKSTDYGKTWASINGNIPVGPANVIREDPKDAKILYVGTDMGVYASLDGGKTYNVVGTNLPIQYVWDLKIHPRDNTIVIATNGRGMWVVKDAASIQKQSK